MVVDEKKRAVDIREDYRDFATLFIPTSATIAATHACNASLVKRGEELHVTVP